MREDVIKWANQEPTAKLVSKESLNHRGLIELASGLDVYADTPQAYRRTYEAVGIDIINRVPTSNAPSPTPPGQITHHPIKPYNYASLGVYDTMMRHTYRCKTAEDVWALDVKAALNGLLPPVPHSCEADDIRTREKAIGQIGLYYPMLYYALFMWAVEVLGWEVFMTAAATHPDRFHEHFLLPCVAESKAIITEMAHASDSPFVFLHDDLANATGPMFQPQWYKDYIFPHYPEILSGARSLGKKIIFVADGNMEALLPQLIEAGIDGVMLETPATPLDAIIEHFGQPCRFFIGGIETAKLTFDSPAEIRKMTLDLHKKMADCPGFAISCCGGLHNNIPLPNLEAYFDARVEIGATPENWRNRSKA